MLRPESGLGATFLVALLAALQAVTGCEPPPETPPAPVGDGFAAVVAVDEHTVVVSFRRRVEVGSVGPGRFSVTDFTVIPPAPLPTLDAVVTGDAEVTVYTEQQQRGRVYTLRLTDVVDEHGFSLDGSINFVGAGAVQRAPVTLAVADLERAAGFAALVARVNVDEEGRFNLGFTEHPLVAGPDSLAAELSIVADPNRTADRGDDGDPVVDRRAYVVALVDASGVPASPLVPIEVPTASALRVEIPLLDPQRRCPDAPYPPLVLPEAGTDPSPGDGLKRVRVVIDDRQSKELVAPALSITVDGAGAFSLEERLVPFEDPDGDRLYELLIELQVAPERINTDLETAPIEELPYVAFLVTDGSKRPELFQLITAVDEHPETLLFPLGAPGKVPVTFRVDIGAAFLSADGQLRGCYPHEAVFITGNFTNIVDALGQNCADSWSGGENLNLRMRERSDAPGVWEKTLWLPPGRNQTWKVVRCDAAQGCGDANARVTSTGRAFPSVMKNLVTHNLDAGESHIAQVVDPYALGEVQVAGELLDYRGAAVYQGEGIGREGDLPGTPDAALLFKQEIPNLLASLADSGDCSVQTQLYVIGTWRDVNLPLTPAEIVETVGAGDPPFDLGPFDYDEGMVGAAPPTREGL